MMATENQRNHGAYIRNQHVGQTGSNRLDVQPCVESRFTLASIGKYQ